MPRKVIRNPPLEEDFDIQASSVLPPEWAGSSSSIIQKADKVLQLLTLRGLYDAKDPFNPTTLQKAGEMMEWDLDRIEREISRRSPGQGE